MIYTEGDIMKVLDAMEEIKKGKEEFLILAGLNMKQKKLYNYIEKQNEIKKFLIPI